MLAYLLEPSNEEASSYRLIKTSIKYLPRYQDGKTYEEISENEANYWHMMQTLTGDSTDGYSGCQGWSQNRTEDIRRPRKRSPLRPMDAWH